jgi:hypothetical protein
MQAQYHVRCSQAQKEANHELPSGTHQCVLDAQQIFGDKWMMLIRPPGKEAVHRYKQMFLTQETGF